MLAEKIRKMTQNLIILISFLLLFLQSCATVKVISDETFDSIANYQYGQDRSNLTEFSHIIQSLSKTPENRSIAEENILDFLQTDATFAAKQFVCRELRKIATEKSVDELTEMLLNEQTVSIAKYALENIQSNDVENELISILDNAPNKSKIAIINIFGARKSKAAVEELGKLLQSKNEDIALASVSALGKIGTIESIEFLKPFILKDNHFLKNTTLDSYLLVADNLVEEGKIDKANKIYNDIYKLNVPLNIKQAALIGVINTSANKPEIILESIKKSPDELKSIPIAKIRELPAKIDMTDFANLLPELAPANQIQMLAVFQDRKDQNIKPFVLETLKSNIPEVRIASIKTLANIGDETDVLKLAKIAANSTGVESESASRTLELLKGKNIDKTIISYLQSSPNKIKVELLKTIRERLINSAFNKVIGYINSTDKKIRTEAFRTLAEISTDKNLSDLLSLFPKQKENTDKKKLERTISKVLINHPSGNNATKILQIYNSTNDLVIKQSLLRLLGFTNDTIALEILRKESNNEDSSIKLSAVQGLSNWTTPEPLNDLNQIMTIEKNEKIKSVALNGFIKFISLNKDLSPCEKVNLYKEALPYAKTSNERNLVLDGIGHSDCFTSLEIVKDYINQPDIKQTVDDAINRVSWHLHKKNPEKVKGYVNWFLSKIKDDHFQKKNKFLLDVIDKFIKNRDANLK